jgi:hypothetical protein
MSMQGGATLLNPAMVNDKPPEANYIRTPGGGWAPKATPQTPGYSPDIENQFVINGMAFPITVSVFPCTIM